MSNPPDQTKTNNSSGKLLIIIVALVILSAAISFKIKESRKDSEKSKTNTEQVENPTAKKTIANEPKDNLLEKDLPKLPDPPKDDF